MSDGGVATFGWPWFNRAIQLNQICPQTITLTWIVLIRRCGSHGQDLTDQSGRSNRHTALTTVTQGLSQAIRTTCRRMVVLPAGVEAGRYGRVSSAHCSDFGGLPVHRDRATEGGRSGSGRHPERARNPQHHPGDTCCCNLRRASLTWVYTVGNAIGPRHRRASPVSCCRDVRKGGGAPRATGCLWCSTALAGDGLRLPGIE